MDRTQLTWPVVDLSAVSGVMAPETADKPRTDVARAGRPGGWAVVIRPACPADLAALGDFFAGLSVHSRYLRFFSPIRPTQALLRRLSGADDDVDAVIAVRDGVIIGHAMASDRAGAGQPAGPLTTDIGVVVADTWQGRGVGSALIRALTGRAQARGVTSIVMDVLHANRRVLAMILRRWPAAGITRYPDCLTLHVRLPRYERLPAAAIIGAPPRVPASSGT